MQSLLKFARLWRQRSVRDAVTISCICFATFFAASRLELFDQLYVVVKYYDSYDLDEIIIVAFAFSFLMLIYALRRAKDLKLEVQRRQEAEENSTDNAARLTAIFNSISQGIMMFDSAEHLVMCNDYFLQMYNLSPDVVKPGATMREIVHHRFEKGEFAHDPEEYYANLVTRRTTRQVLTAVVETTDGREIMITNYPLADGGWVTTHEDQTEARRREASFRLLFDNNPVAMAVFDRDTLRFLAVNDAAISLYGFNREKFLTMVAPDLRATEVGRLAYVRGMPDAESAQHVRRHRRADGTEIHVNLYSRKLKYDNKEAWLVAIDDITSRKLIEDDLSRTKKFLDTVIENVPLPIMVKTASDARFILINKASEELFGNKRENVIGKTLHEIYAKDHADSIAVRDKACMLSDEPVYIIDHVVPTAKGERHITSKRVAIRGDDGTPEYLLTVIDDVTERREAEKRIAHMANSDPLTGLPNRTAFNKYLCETLELAEKENRSFAILCMDLDGFKGVNDIFGHAIGDLLLCQVANRLRAVADGIFVARLGGDEFTIVAANEENTSIAELAGRLQAAFVDEFEIDGHHLPQALSIGVAVYPADGADAKTLLNNADAALYQAKAEGSGSVQYFKAEVAVRLLERAALQADLRTAIQHGELGLHYQPQLKMAGAITGFEALARWNSPTRGMVSPAEFIPLAEESSLILVLGEWVLREACREAASWEAPLKIAINISPVQFRHGDLPQLVHSVLLETGLAASRLELEITEGVLIDDFSRAVSILRRLKSLGVQIAMDDFGKGYSSLCYLHAFPFDKLKIDRSFISDLETNHHSIAIVRAVIGLGRSLDIPIVAEGVETNAQYKWLRQEGCDEVQGYLTGRPLAIEDYADVVGRKMLAIAKVG
jgi:diguanylate cyclase (GGDEF)-like protein/PAS domain S-box-containing protein